MNALKKYRRILLALLIITMFLSAGCGHMRHAVPAHLENSAVIPGMADVRAYADVPDKAFMEDLYESFKQESAGDYKQGMSTVYPVLLVSGGAANGAYGAGVLNGWSASGKRPNFKAVTGISTGALIAPFAFLGSDYDDDLKTLYTTMSTKDVMSPKGPLAAMTSDSFASNRPLERTIRKFVTNDIINKVAQEHDKGRRLYIGTTNLDAQRLVVWNMGKIAKIGTDDSEKLFEDVLLASAAIPIAFPPVFIDVEADGGKYDEMHVDGGTVTQVFSLYGVLQGEDKKKKVDIYVMRNGYVDPKPQAIKDDLTSIANRTIDTMVNYQGLGDIFRLYVLSGERGHNFHVAYIPVDFDSTSKEMFDPVEMTKLFNVGYEQGKTGEAWKDKPPFFDTVGKD
jgi:acyl-CoA-binding protein